MPGNSSHPQAGAQAAAKLDAATLATLRCPVCRGSLARALDALACAACGRHFPFKDGIPVLLAAAALPTTGFGH